MTIEKSAPLVLLVNPDEIFARSLQSILSPSGCSVLWAPTARSALEQEQRARPDAAIIAMELTDGGGALALCRTLRHERGLSLSTPIFLTQPSAATRPQRIEALLAGADELWGQPMDPEEFRLRLAAQLRAKADADQARQEGLIDDRSRLWNHRGLLRRTEELLAASAREHAPIGVAVVDIDADAQQDPLEIGDRMAGGLRRWARLSDALGRLDKAQFAVTTRSDRAACARLGARLLKGLDWTFDQTCSWLRIGFVAFADGAAAPAAGELLECGTVALRQGAASPLDSRLRYWRI